jgi:hypothetical protein
MAMDTSRGYISGCAHHEPDVPAYALTVDEMHWILDACKRGALIARPDPARLKASLTARKVDFGLL